MPFSFDKLLSHYRYTWALTSMVFGVTTMMGVFADMVGKHDPNNCLYPGDGCKFQKHCQLSVMGIRKIRGRLLRSNTNLCQFHDSVFNT